MEAMSYEKKRETILSFNKRVEAASSRAAPSKDWVRAALRRKGSKRCPIRLKRLSYDIILKYPEGLAQLFEEYPDDVTAVQAYDATIGRQGEDEPDRIDPIRVLTEDADWKDEWGTSWRHAADGVGATPSTNPIGDWSLLEDYLGKRMPDPRAPDRLREVLPAAEALGRSRYFMGMAHLALFERYHCLRGMENALADFYLNPTEARRLLSALTEYFVGLVGAWGRLGSVDCLFLTDDWGTQKSLMISPEMWSDFFAPGYRRICDAAHAAGMEVCFHSCGNVMQIVGGLVDAGVDIIDPLQPEAIDLGQVVREYGGNVAFSGGISDQALAGYSPEKVRDEVRKTIDLLGVGSGNAYIVAPSNVLPPDIPFENIVALFEACHGT
jgi:uroporphyrinogen decarboxylase